MDRHRGHIDNNLASFYKIHDGVLEKTLPLRTAFIIEIIHPVLLEGQFAARMEICRFKLFLYIFRHFRRWFVLEHTEFQVANFQICPRVVHIGHPVLHFDIGFFGQAQLLSYAVPPHGLLRSRLRAE